MKPVDRANRIDPAIRARRARSDRLIAEVEKAIRQLRKAGAAVTMRGVAQCSGVSRTFLYENDAARQLVQQAAAATGARNHAPACIEPGAEVGSGWRERALNAESALQAANTEIHRQRDRIGELMGQLRTSNKPGRSTVSSASPARTPRCGSGYANSPKRPPG